jgi:hypothetical protein
MSLTGRLDRLERATPTGREDEYEPAVIEGLRRHAYEAREDRAEPWEKYAAMSPRRVVRAAAAVWAFPLAGLVDVIREGLAIDDTFGRMVELLPERHRAGLEEWMTLLLARDDAHDDHPYRRAGCDLMIEAIGIARGKEPFPPAEIVVRWVERGPFDAGARRIWPPGGAR